MTQTERVLNLLSDAGSKGITSIDAFLAIGTMRLAARISDLRAMAYVIESNRVKGQHFVRYVLKSEISELWDAQCEVCGLNTVAVSESDFLDADFCPTCNECERVFTKGEPLATR